MKTGLNDILTFSGTTNRTTWWLTGLLFAAIASISEGILPSTVDPLTLNLCAYLGLFMIYTGIAIKVARLKEAGWSGWWVLLPPVSFVVGGFFPPKTECICEK